MGLRKHHCEQSWWRDGISAELFQILKDDAVNVILYMPVKSKNSAVATELEKVSFHSNPKERPMPKNAQSTTQLHSSHMLVK